MKVRKIENQSAVPGGGDSRRTRMDLKSMMDIGKNVIDISKTVMDKVSGVGLR